MWPILVEVSAVQVVVPSMKRHTHKAHAVRRASKAVRLLAYAVLIGIGVSVLGTIVVTSIQSREASPPLHEIEVTASMNGFSQNSVRVKAGERVRLRLTSTDNAFHPDGGGQHQWAIDELNLNVIAPPLGSEDLLFVASRPGTYIFYCDICCGGRESPTMQGTLIVDL